MTVIETHHSGEWWYPDSVIASIKGAPPIQLDEQGRAQSLFGIPIVWNEKQKQGNGMTKTSGTESNDTRPTIEIEYGNIEGQYFTQWRIDLLEYMLNTIVFAYENVPLVEVQDAKIWYDNQHDFHMLEFISSGLLFTVRLYKVFSLDINGADHWRGCLRSELGRMAFEIRKICKSGKVV